ncbi:MAG: rhodanese-like domain-containing protein [Flavobacteriales bacterium]|nr:rhodanese-like domain-containing protein [Flavobacteriales bacterium]
MRPSIFLFAILTFALHACAQSAQHVKRDLDPKEFQQAIEEGDAMLIDVRTDREYASGHIPGSVNIDWTAPDYETKFGALDKERPVLLYCHGGGRSDQAKEYLEANGFDVKHLAEGFVAWKGAGLPTTR